MKKNLLTIVQDILSDISGDEVNSIGDTVESDQVTNIVESTFNAMMANREWPHTKTFVNMISYSSQSFPTHMDLPSAVKKVILVNYDKKSPGDSRMKYEEIKYKEPEAFLRMVNQRDDSLSNIDVISDPSGIILNIYNDRSPNYYTSFNDKTLVFDAYNILIENTLMPSKTQVYVYLIPGFEKSNDFIPDLPDEAFPAFIEECKSACSLKLRQIQDVKSEQEAQRQQRWLSRNAWVVAGGIKRPNYGRRSMK